MKRVYETCVLRDEIARGEMPEDQFAARLADVISGRAHPVYGDPKIFFSRTHPTAGLKELLELALGRLSGKRKSANSVLRLETSFGGGKTHSLIALYHAARGAAPALLKEFVDPTLLPKKPIRTATIVGSDLDPIEGLKKPDGTRTFTVWGEMAWQLGGKDGFKLVAESDKRGVAPGAEVLRELIGTEPCLILVDEIARHLRAAREKKLAKGTLDGQVPAFFHSLIELAGSLPSLVLVITLASKEDAYGEELEGFLAKLDEVQSILARVERTLKPVGQVDLAPVVGRRLFETIDRSEAPAVAKAFQQWYEKLFKRGDPIPEEVTRAGYREAIAAAYPFHPALLNILDNKVSTIPKFQRTRGALRLLGLMVRRLFDSRSADAFLIQPHDLDVAVPEIAADVTTRLGLQLAPAIQADIASGVPGAPAHAEAYDDLNAKDGRPPVAIRVARSIFLHSLSSGNAGCDKAELALATTVPDQDPQYVENALIYLVDKAWHLHPDGLRYRFKPEASLTKVIATEMNHVTAAEAKKALTTRIREIYRGSTLTLADFPDEPGAVADDDKPPKLAVLHFDAESAEPDAPGLPPLVKRLFESKDKEGGFRVHQNNVIFLVANAAEVDRLVETSKRLKAIQAILSAKDRMKELGKEQQEDLKGRRDTAENDLRVAVTACYRHLYFPSGAREAKDGLLQLTLTAQDATQAKRVQQEVLVETLREQKKLLTGEDRPLAALFVRDKVWPGQQEEMALDAFASAFARKRDLPIHLDKSLLKETVRNGVKTAVWGYDDGRRVYVKADGEPDLPEVQLVKANRLLTVEAALRLKQQREGKKPKEPKPPEGGDGPQPPPPPPPPPAEGALRGSGTPKKAFQEVRDEAKRRKVDAVEEIAITSQAAADVPRLGLAISRWPDVPTTLEVEIEATIGDDTVTICHTGTWDRYRALVKSAADELVRAAPRDGGAAEATVKVTLRPKAAAPLAVEAKGAFQNALEALVDLEVGAIELVAQPAKSKVLA